MTFFRIRSICSCALKAISKIFGLCQERTNNKAHNDPTPNDRASVQFSIETSLQESSIAPMSSLSLVASEQSSSMVGYGTELSESSSPESTELGKQLSPSSTFASASSSSLDVSDGTYCENGSGALVTPVEHGSKNIGINVQSNNENTSALRPNNLNATHFYEHSPVGFGSSFESITPSESGTANTGRSSIFKVDTNIISDASPSSIDSTESIIVEEDKKKYPVTPYPKIIAAFSSPSVQVKAQATKLPKSVITMRRGLVKTRVGNIQKKLDAASGGW